MPLVAGPDTPGMKKLPTLAIGTATATALLLGGLAPLQAVAYPPGTSMTVTASRVSAGKSYARFAVIARKVKPGCQVRLATPGHSKVVRANAHGAAAAVLAVNGPAHSYRVTADTVGCATTEHAAQTVEVSSWTLLGPKKVKRNKNFAVSVRYWKPNTSITIKAKRGDQVVTRVVRTNSKGRATVTFKLWKRGTWVIIATQRGHGASYQVRVS